jgi:hypothetical protein
MIRPFAAKHNATAWPKPQNCWRQIDLFLLSSVTFCAVQLALKSKQLCKNLKGLLIHLTSIPFDVAGSRAAKNQ